MGHDVTEHECRYQTTVFEARADIVSEGSTFSACTACPVSALSRFGRVRSALSHSIHTACVLITTLYMRYMNVSFYCIPRTCQSLKSLTLKIKVTSTCNLDHEVQV